MSRGRTRGSSLALGVVLAAFAALGCDEPSRHEARPPVPATNAAGEVARAHSIADYALKLHANHDELGATRAIDDALGLFLRYEGARHEDVARAAELGIALHLAAADDAGAERLVALRLGSAPLNNELPASRAALVIEQALPASPIARAILWQTRVVSLREAEGGESPRLAQALVRLADLASDACDAKLADASSKRALAVVERVGDAATLAEALVKLARARHVAGDDAQSVALLARARTVAEGAGPPAAKTLVTVLQKLARVAPRAGDQQEARALLDRSMSVAERSLAFGETARAALDAFHCLHGADDRDAKELLARHGLVVRSAGTEPRPSSPSPACVPNNQDGISEASAAVAALAPKLRHCFNVSLAHGGAPNAQMVGEVDVLGSGEVPAARVVAKTDVDADLAACVLGVITSARFAPTAGGDNRVIVIPLTMVTR